MKVAFVIQRYGKEVVGGSELECRLVAEHLVRKGFECTVFTTAAKDYITWRNEYNPGETILNGVSIKRFQVKKERNIETFNSFSDRIFSQSHTRDEELEWMRQQGPECSGLIEALERKQQKHDIFIFFTYLYYTTYWGLKKIKNRKALVPTAHDEPALYLEIMKEVFAAPEAFVFNTEAEKAIVGRQFPLGNRYQSTIGIGLDIPEIKDPSSFLQKFSLTKPFLLYAGRIEKGKGCEELIRYFLRYSQKNKELSLVLIGKLLMELPRHPQLRYLGFVSNADKTAAMASAAVTVHPSYLESLCIAALESMAVGTPILVQERTAPLQHHSLNGKGGLTFSNYDEFEAALALLLSDARLRRVLGINGRSYVRDNYSWPMIIEKYERMFEHLKS
jgi:glycosyltransferase involved in cell wall biosynthesis